MQQFFVDIPLCSRCCVMNGAEGRERPSSECYWCLFFPSNSYHLWCPKPKYPVRSLTYFFFPFVFLALGCLALWLTEFFCSDMCFLIEAKCLLNCKGKQNISTEKYPLRNTEVLIPYIVNCVWVGTSLVRNYMVRKRKTQPLALANPFMALQMVGCIFLRSPNRPKGGAPVPTHTADSASLQVHCLVSLSAPTPQAIFSMEEEGEKNPLKTIQSWSDSPSIINACLDIAWTVILARIFCLIK